jgi:hypothetical protein
MTKHYVSLVLLCRPRSHLTAPSGESEAWCALGTDGVDGPMSLGSFSDRRPPPES